MDIQNRIALVTGAGEGTGRAKAGSMRATACLGDLPGVVIDRALASLAPGDETPPVTLGALCDAVIDLVEDESARGKVVVLSRG
ncbi:hypothetical protein [Actinophytocola algeriensis]|uniref:NAD(P)-dependent dehydrogenase (Short-subunit alcohol dehydrogenase family) n=1 Tax=Actinophytocola algeriensis TaxID=1768010 RepID=A0A7W7Q6B6_9PSEU|nr:hypothetical protein [Actinophytocola algeriensis]MBB4907877.1 NAD(P)-dependent dehydrogenase (short-subunit alcohol dehydrogenase family) [Actinophytocola algeriensis]MBE1479907.1 NAD(P)-dependent dehydrogenase (short-subunit alcohol dehydrogenase family) [Actinophytocola algeriensis]